MAMITSAALVARLRQIYFISNRGGSQIWVMDATARACV
jgi:hypothetical protein